MSTILDLVQPDPEAKWVIFYSLGEGSDGGTYYDAHPLDHMRSKLAMLAYDMNGEQLSYGHGAPLGLRNEIELGSSRSNGSRGSSSSPTSPRSAAASAATTRTTSSSATASPSSPAGDRSGHPG